MTSLQTPRQILGKKGEKIALNFLKKKGYKILEKNFRSENFGEIDLIAYDHNQLVFIEVKTKSTHQFGLPEEEFNFHKKRKLFRAINNYFWQKKIENDNWRIDLVTVDFSEIKPKIYHYQAV